jgi:hypothetical protein
VRDKVQLWPFFVGFCALEHSSKKHGKDMTTACTWKEKMAKAGFINVHEDVYKVLLTSELFLVTVILTVL